jgi:PAS domain S-box-containing protein
MDTASKSKPTLSQGAGQVDEPDQARQFWQRLIEPGPELVDYHRRMQARFLMSLLIVMAPLGLILTLVISRFSLQDSALQMNTVWIAIAGIGAAAIAWLVSRTARYQVAAMLIVVGVTAAVYVSALILPDPTKSRAYFFLILPAIVAKFMLGRRLMVAIMLTHLALIALVGFLRPSPDALGRLVEPFTFYLLISVLLVIIDVFREKIEADRRQLIETTNQRLQMEVAERKQAEARFSYQANLLENVSDAIIAVDTSFTIQSWNRAAEILYGWSVAEAIGQPLNTLIMEEYTSQEARSIFSGLMRTRSWRGELSHRNRMGEDLHVQVSSTLLKDESGGVTGLVMLNQDITERKQTALEEARQRSMAQALQETTALLNSSLNLSVVLDRLLIQVERVLPFDTASIMLIEDGMATISHHRGFEAQGFAPADLKIFRLNVQEKESLRWMTEQRRPMLIADTAKALWWSQEPAAIWIKSYLGSPIQIDDEVIGFINLDRAEVGGFTWEQADLLKSFADQAAIAIRNARLYDLAQSRAEEQERQVIARTADLERERSQLRAILDSMSEGVLCVMFGDMPETITNRALEKMAGTRIDASKPNILKPDDMTESEFNDLLDETLTRVSETGSHHLIGRIKQQPDGDVEVHVSNTAVRDSEGKMIGLLQVFRDISEEKALADKKSRFVANASHELRTPLTNLMTRLYIFRKAPERYDEHLTILEDVAERMRRLVDDLLDYSRFERGMIPLERQAMDLRPVLEAVAARQLQEAERKSIQIHTELPDTPLPVLADEDRIAQVFTNLVTNAINYTPQSGHITLRAQTNHEHQVVIEVMDTGVGIPPAALADIFEPFVRAHENTRGTGLGLSITHDIVRLHEGSITVTSEVNKGSTFTVRLPRYNSAAGDGTADRSG